MRRSLRFLAANALAMDWADLALALASTPARGDERAEEPRLLELVATVALLPVSGVALK